jgi:hypothetical protein
MFELINKLHNIFVSLKNFQSGYSSSSNGKMVVKYMDKYYLLELSELEPYISEKLKKKHQVSDEEINQSPHLKEQLEFSTLIDMHCVKI